MSLQAFEPPEESAREMLRETVLDLVDLASRLVVFDAARGVGRRSPVVRQATEHNRVERSIQLAVASATETVPV